MKKIFISILMIFALTPVISYAATPNLQNAFDATTVQKTAENAGYSTDSTKADPLLMVQKVISVALSLLGVIFLGLSIYAGYLWMTARDEEAKVEEAQKILKAAVIGLIIVVSAYAISYFVIAKFTATTLKV